MSDSLQARIRAYLDGPERPNSMLAEFFEVYLRNPTVYVEDEPLREILQMLREELEAARPEKPPEEQHHWHECLSILKAMLAEAHGLQPDQG